MPDIKLHNAPVEEAPELEMLTVTGTLDVATIPALEESLETMRQQGRSRLVVNLAGLEYVSSSGLGAFLGMVDGFRDHGGDLAFIQLTDRVKKIFTVVGFTRILTILDDMPAALGHFGVGAAGAVAGFQLKPSQADPHSGEKFQLEILAVDAKGKQVKGFSERVDLRPSTGIISPAHTPAMQEGRWIGTVVLTGPGTVTLTAAHGDVESTMDFPLREDKPAATLPTEVRCPRCGVSITINQFNVFRCKQCDEVFFVDKWAHTISLKSPESKADAPKVCQLRIPADVNLLGPTRVFLASSMKESGYSKDMVNDIELCVDEAITNVVEHAYEYDIAGSVNLQLVMEKDKVSLTIKDQGKPFDPHSLPRVDLDKHIEQRKTGGLGYYLMNTFMDEVNYEHDGTSNILTMVKKVEKAREGAV